MTKKQQIIKQIFIYLKNKEIIESSNSIYKKNEDLYGIYYIKYNKKEYNNILYKKEFKYKKLKRKIINEKEFDNKIKNKLNELNNNELFDLINKNNIIKEY